MEINERNKKMKIIFDECLALSKRKGKDYTGGEDSLANLRVFGFKGIIIRLFDKLYRLKSIEESGKVEVLDETIDDTLMDIIIYAALAKILLRENDFVPFTISKQDIKDFGISGEIEVVSTEDKGDMWEEKIGK